MATATELARNSGLRVLGCLTKPVSREGIKHTLAGFTTVRPTSVKAGERHQDFEPTVDDLRAAIANDEVVVYYQPRVLIATRQACGLEALNPLELTPDTLPTEHPDDFEPGPNAALVGGQGVYQNGPNNNQPTEMFFHTNEDGSPWLDYDLGKAHAAYRSEMQNRSDCCAERAAVLEVGLGQDHFREIAQKNESFAEWNVSFTLVTVRSVHLRVARRSILHFERVVIR